MVLNSQKVEVQEIEVVLKDSAKEGTHDGLAAFRASVLWMKTEISEGFRVWRMMWCWGSFSHK